MLFRGRATHARASITVPRRITLRILIPEESSLLPALTIPSSTASLADRTVPALDNDMGASASYDLDKDVDRNRAGARSLDCIVGQLMSNPL